MALADKGGSLVTESHPPCLVAMCLKLGMVRTLGSWSRQANWTWREGGMFLPVSPKEKTSWAGFSRGIFTLAADFNPPWSI